jgi:formylmethanofuran dehydrogenase subunit C
MSERITITLDRAPPQRIELDAITPDRLVSLSTGEIAALPVWVAGRQVALGDLGHVEGERSAHVRLDGDLARADGVGAGMCGGVLEVSGSVGDGAGVGMSAGVLKIGGDAGARVGGALPGASKGMSGGEIIVHGRAGAEAGASARRGLIVVQGDVGDDAARGMIAGTLVACSAIGANVGAWNKRGSVVALGAVAVPSTYRFACVYQPTVLRVLFGYLRRAYGIAVPDPFVVGRWNRYCGDLSELGKGELFTWAEA